MEIFSFFNANEIYCKVRILSKKFSNIEEIFGYTPRDYKLKIYPPIKFNEIPYWLNKLLALSNNISIVIRRE